MTQTYTSIEDANTPSGRKVSSGLYGFPSRSMGPATHDVNPNPDGTGLSLNIDEYYNSLDLDVAIDASPSFGLKRDKAIKLTKEMQEKTKGWKHVTESFHIPRKASSGCASAPGLDRA